MRPVMGCGAVGEGHGVAADERAVGMERGRMNGHAVLHRRRTDKDEQVGIVFLFLIEIGLT